MSRTRARDACPSATQHNTAFAPAAASGAESAPFVLLACFFRRHPGCVSGAASASNQRCVCVAPAAARCPQKRTRACPPWRVPTDTVGARRRRRRLRLRWAPCARIRGGAGVEGCDRVCCASYDVGKRRRIALRAPQKRRDGAKACTFAFPLPRLRWCRACACAEPLPCAPTRRRGHESARGRRRPRGAGVSRRAPLLGLAGAAADPGGVAAAHA